MLYSPSEAEKNAAAAFAPIYVANQRAGGAGRHDEPHRVRQAYKSKLAEYAWASLVGGEVDVKHFKAHFGSDLLDTAAYPLMPLWKGYDLHVKSFSMQRGRHSWLVDNNDPVLLDPTIRDLFLLAVHDDREGMDDIEIVGMVRAQAINHLMEEADLLDKMCFKRFKITRQMIPVW